MPGVNHTYAMMHGITPNSVFVLLTYQGLKFFIKWKTINGGRRPIGLTRHKPLSYPFKFPIVDLDLCYNCDRGHIFITCTLNAFQEE